MVQHSDDHIAVVRLLGLPALGSRRLLSLMQHDRPGDIVTSILGGRIGRSFDEFAAVWKAELAADIGRRSDTNIVHELADTFVVS
ncbi:MAG: hypothetical protein ACO22B_11425, partial [Ilumatobacteraceae bacterium]